MIWKSQSTQIKQLLIFSISPLTWQTEHTSLSWNPVTPHFMCTAKATIPHPYSKTFLRASTRDFPTSLTTWRSLMRHHHHTRKLYQRSDTIINWNMNLKTNKGITTESALEMLRGLIHLTVKMWPPTLAEHFSTFLREVSHQDINSINFSIEILWNYPTVVCLILRTS